MSVLSDRRLLDQLFARWGPVVHARDALSCGLPRGLLVRAVDRTDLIRLGKAAFVRTVDWDRAGARDRLRFRTLAFGLCLGGDAHLTGAGAALLLDVPLVDDPTGTPIAIRPGNAHTGHDRSPYGRVRHGYLPQTCRTERHRVPVVSPAFCVVDIARHLGPRDGLVTADAVLHAGVDPEAVTRIAENMLAYPGIESVAWVAEHADRRVESPLESLCRYAFLAADRRPPLSNVWIGAGSRWFRVDHLLPDDGVVLEGDGAVKYRDRPDADTIVRDEKERERLIRALGYGVVRYTWADAIGSPDLLSIGWARRGGFAGMHPCRPAGVWTRPGPIPYSPIPVVERQRLPQRPTRPMNSCADESGLNVTGGTENEEVGRAGVVDPRVAASAFDAGPPASAQWR